VRTGLDRAAQCGETSACGRGHANEQRVCTIQHAAGSGASHSRSNSVSAAAASSALVVGRPTPCMLLQRAVGAQGPRSPTTSRPVFAFPLRTAMPMEPAATTADRLVVIAGDQPLP
jgi:hypothetical protein